MPPGEAESPLSRRPDAVKQGEGRRLTAALGHGLEDAIRQPQGPGEGGTHPCVRPGGD